MTCKIYKSRDSSVREGLSTRFQAPRAGVVMVDSLEWVGSTVLSHIGHHTPSLAESHHESTLLIHKLLRWPLLRTIAAGKETGNVPYSHASNSQTHQGPQGTPGHGKVPDTVLGPPSLCPGSPQLAHSTLSESLVALLDEYALGFSRRFLGGPSCSLDPLSASA